MTVGSQPVQNYTTLLPTTTVLPKDPNELLIVLTKNFTDISNSVNIKEIAIYVTTEILTGEQWETPGQPTLRKQAFRTVINVTLLNGGNIPGGATITMPHNISGIVSSTNIYASCTSSAQDFFNVVYPNARLAGPNFVFTNPLPATPLTQVYLVCEYLKN